MRDAARRHAVASCVFAVSCVAMGSPVLDARPAPANQGPTKGSGASGQGPAFMAVLAIRRGECPSRLEFAHIFERRSPLRARLQRVDWLDERTSRMSVLLLYDASGTLRMALSLPATVPAADRLVRWIARPTP